MHSVIIIGAGLSGLTTAYSLNKKGIDCLILEARERSGGRIHTLEGPLEMGATWLGQQHKHLRDLLNELGVEVFEQFTAGKISYDLGQHQPIQFFDMPEGQAPSYRIKGGTCAIIQGLIDRLTTTNIRYASVVKRIQDQAASISVSLADGAVFEAKQVIITTPPQLTQEAIEFFPPIPSKQKSMMEHTHTWMGESIKYGVTYSSPFWKEKGLSGMGFSQAGVLQEVHDHCNFEEDYFALKGFLNSNLSAFKQDDRRQMVISTLCKLFGDSASDYLSYNEQVWQHDEFTSLPKLNQVAPHQNNGNSLLRETLYNEKLIFSGTETSPVYGGYMDGAVYSGLLSAQLAGQHYERLAKS